MAGPPPSLDALLEALRERPAQVARTPRAALGAGLAQLRKVRAHDPPAGESAQAPHEYRIDDLARVAGMTTRNVRAYQDRGLLPPPRRSGRVALYNDTHVARLKLIGSMLERGYTTAHIAEMLTAWERGGDLGDVLGVEQELARPWSDDAPAIVPLQEARALAGDTAAFERLVAFGLIVVRGSSRAVVTQPRLLAAFAELRGHGMPMQTVLDLYLDTVEPLDDIAGRLVLAAARHFATVKGPAWVPDADEVSELVEVLARFRSLAMTSVTDTLAAAMERAVERVLGAYLAQLAEAQQARARDGAAGDGAAGDGDSPTRSTDAG